MITALDVLEQSRALITEPQHWTQDVYARDENGIRTSPESSTACQFCSLGAIRHVFNKNVADSDGILDNMLVDYDARVALERVMGSIANFNDDSSHKQVLFAWDQAIEQLKQEQSK